MKLLHRFINWIENGDLIPAVILVSIPHYAHVLSQYDFAPVAAAIGFLVDVGHYRTIKLYLKGRGALWMVVLTVISAGFHIAFYLLGGAGWIAILLGLAPVAVIFSLAYITRSEKLDTKMGKQESHGTLTESRGNPTETKNSLTSPTETMIPDFETYVRFNESRNGNGAISPKELIETYGVSRSTAYRWHGQYQEAQKVKVS